MKKAFFKKSMALFLTVLMVMSCWVWVAPEHAHAAAGSYYVKITWACKNKRTYDNNYTGYSNRGNGQCGISLFYKSNNGTGTESEVYWNIGKGTGGSTGVSNTGWMNTTGTYSATVTVSGFPTRVFIYSDNNYVLDESELEVTKIEVGSSSSATLTTLWAGTVYIASSTEPYYVEIKDGVGTGNHDDYAKVSTTTASWVYPYAKTITWSNTPEEMTCPKTASDAAATQTVAVSAKDQYGVQMFDPTWKVSGNIKTTGITVSPTTSSGSTTISVTSSANILNTTNSQTGTVTATWSTPSSTGNTSKTSSKTFKINDATYNATFTGHRNADGVLQEAYKTTAQYGVTPTAPAASNYSEGDYDYTFTGWNPTVTGISADTTYTAIYSNGTFVGADYTAVNEAKAAADAIKANYGTDYELKYTLESRAALDSAINAVVTGLGRTQQNVVDGYAAEINAKIAALEPNKFDVIFLDKDGAILLYEKDVEYKEAVTAPTYSATYYDSVNHYTFAGWDTDEYASVVDDLVIQPVFSAEAHSFTTETVESNCVTKGATKYTCSCGYSYVDGETNFGDHVWASDYTTDLEPTCTVAGSKSIHCTLCDAQKDITAIDPLGHQWGSQSVAVEATCGKIGIMSKVCDDCGVCEHTIIDALEHDYKETVVAPTCTAKGYTEYVCQRANCGHSYRDNYTDTVAHNYGAWETVSEARCEVAGVKKRVCEDCGFTEIGSIDALSHVLPTEWTVVVNPTCTGEGYRTKTCTLCGVVKESEEIPASNHNYEVTKDTPATCTAAGEKVETCSVCGDTNTKVIQPLGHDYDDGVEYSADCTHGGFKVYSCKRTDCNHKKYEVLDEATANGHNFENGTETVIKEATCTEDGEKTVQCTNDSCEYKINVVIPKTGHNHVAGTAVDATCTSSGYTPYTCACGDTYNVYNESAPAKGHDFSVFVSKSDATCTADGSETYKCSRCAETDVKVLPKTGHSYVKGAVVNADCTTAGTEVYTCACGDTYTKFIEAAKGHTWGDWTVTQAATADKFGIQERKCTVCNAVEIAKVTPIGDHEFNEVVTKNATCTETGLKTYTCTKHENCSANYEEVIPATGHKAKLVYEAPTCKKEGSTKITCETCSTDISNVESIPVAAHAYGAGVQTKAPTCTEDGVMAYTCTACGDSRTEVVAKTGHSLSTVLEKATCTKAGSVTTTCSKCTYAITTEIPSNGHTVTVTTVPATCTADGSVTEKCDVCGETKVTTLVSPGHNFSGAETIVTPATCTTAGEKTIKCLNCDVVTKIAIPAKGHDFSGEAAVVDATCTKDGSKTVKCANCSEVQITVLPKLGHDWNDWVKVDATNDKDGSWTRTCKNGTCTETVVIPKGGHTFGNGEVTKNASCNSTGTMVYKCTAHADCGVTLEVTIPETQHTVTQKINKATCTQTGSVVAYCSACDVVLSTKEIPVKAHEVVAGTPVAPTCVTSGYIPYSCECGFSYNVYDENNPATGHFFDETITANITTIAADCTNDGSKTVKCRYCDVVNTTVLPKTGHSYVKGTVVNADCTTAGTEVYTCSCGDTYTKFVEAAKAHSWSDWKETQAATADMYGIKERTCTACGVIEIAKVAPIGDHEFNEVVTKNATCTEAGLKTYTCTKHANCSANYEEEIPATGHTQTITYNAPTCISVGSSKIVCSKCSEELESYEVPVIGYHDFSGEGVKVEAGCETEGSITYTCETDGCTATKTETIPAKGHDYETVVNDAKCGEKGSVTISCKNCTKSETIELAIKGHIWETTPVSTEDATCEEDGSATYKCQNCAETNVVVIPKLGHDWNNWVVVPSKNDEAGSVSRTCSRGCSETVDIPAGNHNLVVDEDKSTDSTCTTEGKTVYKCENHADCGITLEVTAALKQHTTKTD